MDKGEVLRQLQRLDEEVEWLNITAQRLHKATFDVNVKVKRLQLVLSEMEREGGDVDKG